MKKKARQNAAEYSPRPLLYRPPSLVAVAYFNRSLQNGGRPDALLHPTTEGRTESGTKDAG